MDKKKLNLKNKPTLQDFQNYVSEMIKERGFKKENISEVFMLFLENSEQFELNHEIADVFIYLLAICNYYNIDLEKSFRDKEEINKKRTWK
jgi:NTP pyrophosphatase (non-canonical NTP hydrolase)